MDRRKDSILVAVSAVFSFLCVTSDRNLASRARGIILQAAPAHFIVVRFPSMDSFQCRSCALLRYSNLRFSNLSPCGVLMRIDCRILDIPVCLNLGLVGCSSGGSCTGSHLERCQKLPVDRPSLRISFICQSCHVASPRISKSCAGKRP